MMDQLQKDREKEEGNAMMQLLTGIKGIGKGTISALADHGFTSIQSLAHASAGQLTSIPRFGEKRAEQVIHAAMELIASPSGTLQTEKQPSGKEKSAKKKKGKKQDKKKKGLKGKGKKKAEKKKKKGKKK